VDAEIDTCGYTFNSSDQTPFSKSHLKQKNEETGSSILQANEGLAMSSSVVFQGKR
jgi:hypothetical protein